MAFGVELSRFGVIVALFGQDWLFQIDQFLVNALYSLGFFCHVWLTRFNLALNICFIIGRQMYM